MNSKRNRVPAYCNAPAYCSKVRFVRDDEECYDVYLGDSLIGQLARYMSDAVDVGITTTVYREHYAWEFVSFDERFSDVTTDGEDVKWAQIRGVVRGIVSARLAIEPGAFMGPSRMGG